MNLTPNLGLGKPLDGEDYDIAVPNTNMDLLDDAHGAIDDRLTDVEGKLPVGVTPSAKVVTTANQSVSNNTAENLDLAGGTGTETLAGMLGISTDRLTIKKAGYYIISASIRWAADTAGFRYTAINKNSGPVLVAEQHFAPTGNTLVTHLNSAPILCALNDYFYVSVVQNSGGALNMLTGSYIQATWIAGP